ncbi:apolipoprotein N-acyltransferase [Marinomonas piezotolerans]|uniref:Apolipoprotein N-acyltransferase n=1 Tax=Marinomonas piezotolerans TaxID=2213058 RepID=A0A370U7Z3_9GAMM|nr:apolipoprotein N-acyltransferase [Marinomonas piezotolerans]RDL43910.1 apolipoprotein N-acyltransferase [Marinomonas piezotolerans]
MTTNATLDTLNVTGWRLRILNSILRSPARHIIISLLLGALSTLSFAPFYIWPLYLLNIAYLYVLLHCSANKKHAFYFGVSNAFGLFGSGISWIYVSIADFGQVGLPIAIGITFGLIAVMSIYWGLIGVGLKVVQTNLSPKFWAVAFITLFLMFEWLRSWLFTGFPWLLPGYISEKSWLFEWLPLGGIWLVSALCLLTSVSVGHFFLQPSRRLLAITSLIWCISGGLSLYSPEYVTASDQHTITLVQGNLAQDEKWLADNAAPTLSYYQQATIENLQSDLVVWPETAITYLLSQVKPYLASFSEELAQQGTTLITGVPVWDQDKDTYYNSVWATGNGFGLYQKQKLVPFGEYIPLANWFGPIFDLFGMPMSQFSRGEPNQPTLQAGELSVAPFICYEVVYPGLVRNMVRDSDVLLTISNDGWFGDSIGPLQHMQIAQFRAKESGRYMIRATNTGVTAIIDEHGSVQAQLPQFTRATLTGAFKTFSGNTPYVMWGNSALWICLICLLAVCLIPSQTRSK